MKSIFYYMECYIRLFKYGQRFYKKQKALGFIPDIRSTDETLDKILREHCSASRFGDGEFNLLRQKGNGFCAYNQSLAGRLQEVLTVPLPCHIVCLPYALVSRENLNLRTKVFWLSYFIKAYDVFKRYLKSGYVYYDASFTRFYFAYKDKRVCKRYLEKIRQIWFHRDILLIEGEYSRLGVNNDLFIHARSLKRILCPAKDAFEKYDDIMRAARKHGSNKLILIALGQTATVLSYDLAKLGYWAIDIGHVDIEYEWFLRGAKDKLPIAGKYVNEAKCDVFREKKIQDENYEKTIVERIVGLSC